MLLTGITLAAVIIGVLYYVLAAPAVWAVILAVVGAWLGLALLAFLFLWALCARVDIHKEETEAWRGPFSAQQAGLPWH